MVGGGLQKMSIKLILLERMKQEPANYALLLLPCGKCVCLCVSLRLPVPAFTSPRTWSDVISKVTWKGSTAPRLLQLDPPSQHQRAHSCFCLRANGEKLKSSLYTRNVTPPPCVCGRDKGCLGAHQGTLCVWWCHAEPLPVWNWGDGVYLRWRFATVRSLPTVLNIFLKWLWRDS